MEEIILCQPIKPKRIRVYANCEHDKKKRNCKVCSPQNYCEHNREKYQCKECGGGSICEHGKKKSICKGFSVFEYFFIKFYMFSFTILPLSSFLFLYH